MPRSERTLNSMNQFWSPAPHRAGEDCYVLLRYADLVNSFFMLYFMCPFYSFREGALSQRMNLVWGLVQCALSLLLIPFGACTRQGFVPTMEYAAPVLWAFPPPGASRYRSGYHAKSRSTGRADKALPSGSSAGERREVFPSRRGRAGFRCSSPCA